MQAQLRFPASLEALAGHFPGRPIVPGAILLSDVAALVVEHWSRQLVRVRQAKFSRPVAPEVDYRVEASERADGGIDFRCSADGATVVSGVLDLQPRP